MRPRGQLFYNIQVAQGRQNQAHQASTLLIKSPVGSLPIRPEERQIVLPHRWMVPRSVLRPITISLVFDRPSFREISGQEARIEVLWYNLDLAKFQNVLRDGCRITEFEDSPHHATEIDDVMRGHCACDEPYTSCWTFRKDSIQLILVKQPA